MVSDEVVMEVLKRHPEIQLTGLLYWSWGMSGTYKIDSDLDPEDILSIGRQRFEQMFSMGHDGTFGRLGEWVENHDRSALLSNDSLQVEARTLMNAYVCFRRRLEDLEKGAAIIYGVEVRGDPSALYTLRRDPAVERFSVEGSRFVRSVKPEALKRQFMDPEIEEMTLEQLYESMQSMTRGR